MSESILNDVKKMNGVANNDTTFDLDFITYINMAFSTLDELGVGPVGGFMVEDKSDEWTDFIESDDVGLNMVKPFVSLTVRLLHDPPATSFVGDALKKSLDEMTWRIAHRREWDRNPVDPMPREEESDED